MARSDTLPLAVPPEAFLHDAAVDYVTDLLVVVQVDGRVFHRTGYLAWTDGRETSPVIWTDAELDVLAPQGVLRAELRAAHLPNSVRVMPELGDAVTPSAPNVDAVFWEVEP